MAESIKEMGDYFKDELKSSDYRWIFHNGGGDGFDWKKGTGETLDDVVKANTDYNEGEAFDVMGVDPDSKDPTPEDAGWEDTKGDNTYNWGYLGPQDANFHLWKGDDKFMLEIAIHQGGDIRGNYGSSYYADLKNEDEFGERIFDIVGGSNDIYLEFSDGTSASFYGTQDSDINAFETADASDKTGVAGELIELLETFNNSADIDDFLIDIAESSGRTKEIEGDGDTDEALKAKPELPFKDDLEEEPGEHK